MSSENVVLAVAGLFYLYDPIFRKEIKLVPLNRSISATQSEPSSLEDDTVFRMHHSKRLTAREAFQKKTRARGGRKSLKSLYFLAK